MSRIRLAIALFLVANPIATSPADDLAQQARSILSNRCFACHGPDADQRQGGFRLDDAQSMLQAADSGDPPIIPGDAAASQVLQRILSEDEGERMPPADFGSRLDREEVETLRRWIDAGAELPQHWSFIAPVRPSPPQVEIPLSEPVPPARVEQTIETDRASVPECETPDLRTWATQPLDRFVLAQQIAHGLRPSPQATRNELLRRLSLDLTGLPPTPDELASFLSDDTPAAYERQVERLLASPAYGEHWARKWLDLARYADSAGYADDPARTIWAYRDWVVQAFNDNQPYDQFTIEQIAGDLLPNPTPEQLVATAFHRNTLTNNEGGTNDEEFRNVAVVDRVNTTMAVWMGVTMACAQCHTHKYDPFTQEEYFELFAIFNQSRDADLKDESPTLELFTPEQRSLQHQWTLRLEELDHSLGEISPALLDSLEKWEQQLREPTWAALTPKDFVTKSKSDFVLAADQTITVVPRGNNIVSDTYTLQLDLLADSQPLQAISLKTIPQAALPNSGAGLAGGNFVITDVTVRMRSAAAGSPPATYVRVELPGKRKMLSLAEVQVIAAGRNVALEGSASQSSTDYGGDAIRAIDGNTSGDYSHNSTTHTAASESPWWELVLEEPQAIDRVVIWNRTDGSLQNRLNGARLQLLDAERQIVFETTLEKAPVESESIAVVGERALSLKAAFADYAQPGFPAEAILDNDKTTGWAVGGRVADSHRLTLLLAEPLQVEEAATLEIEIGHHSTHRHHLLGSFRVEQSHSHGIADWSKLSSDMRAIQQQPRESRSAAAQRQLAEFYARYIAAENAELRSERNQIAAQLAKLKPATSVPVMREVQETARRPTFVQIRGNYKALGQQVAAGTPDVFHPLTNISVRESTGEAESASEGAATQVDRLALAHWLVDRRNPLTARVLVNRMWESLFGIGIVRSSEEFGAQGDRPSHPQLLDWLACELMDSGWDVKHILRLMVHSATYRQSSRVTPSALEVDKDNIWLARGPRVRLSAEMVRDQALVAAGLLSRKMFGPPVRPPQPNMGLKAAFGSETDWKTSEGEDRYRRGLYTTWRRSNPYPSMATFDAPSREVCTLRRDSTNTPLQALVTLNDPGFVEAAQALARRVCSLALTSTSAGGERADRAPDQDPPRAPDQDPPRAPDEDPPRAPDEDPARAPDENTVQKLNYAFLWCTSRTPSPQETQTLLDLVATARDHFSQNPQDALLLATDPLGPLPAGSDPVELAVWTSVGNVLLNLDEVLMKR